MSTIVRLQRVYDKVIFDMDGTLVDSHAVVERAWRKWASSPLQARILTISKLTARRSRIIIAFRFH